MHARKKVKVNVARGPPSTTNPDLNPAKARGGTCRQPTTETEGGEEGDQSCTGPSPKFWRHSPNGSHAHVQYPRSQGVARCRSADVADFCHFREVIGDR